jgi:hypothetical protein
LRRFSAAQKLSGLAGDTTEIVVINSAGCFLSLPLMPQVQRPLMGLAGDAQWPDRASAQVPGFAARALAAASRSQRSGGCAR